MVSQLSDRSPSRNPSGGDDGRPDRFRLALRDSDLSSTARLIAYTLSTYDLGTESPSLSELARASGVCRRTVVRALNALETAWIERTRPAFADRVRGARTRYALCIPSEAATVTVIKPGRVGRNARYLMNLLACSADEAHAMIDAVRAESAKPITNMGGYLYHLHKTGVLGDLLTDIREAAAEPAAAGAAGTPGWCEEHGMSGGTGANGQPRCPLCRRKERGSRATP